MNLTNVQLWFAKDIEGNIVTIDEVKENNTYNCPICDSELIPKAITSNKVSPHFAHIDKSKCNSETMIHFWFKHRFIEKGDRFRIRTDKEIEYICKEVLVEQIHKADDKIYKPDVTILTECGKTIYFEMKYSNKKEIKDYLDIWLELKNIVVEVDIKQLTNSSTLPIFNALFYEGKCFNTKINDTYYNTIGKYKEQLYTKPSDDIKERIKKLDWFWDELVKYKKGKTTEDAIFEILPLLKGEDMKLIKTVLKTKHCVEIFIKYMEYITDDMVEVANLFITKHELIYSITKEPIIRCNRLSNYKLRFKYIGGFYLDWHNYQFTIDILNDTEEIMINKLKNALINQYESELKSSQTFKYTIERIREYYNYEISIYMSDSVVLGDNIKITFKTDRFYNKKYNITIPFISIRNNTTDLTLHINNLIQKEMYGISELREREKLEEILDELEEKFVYFPLKIVKGEQKKLFLSYSINHSSISVNVSVRNSRKYHHSFSLESQDIFSTGNLIDKDNIIRIIEKEIAKFIFDYLDESKCCDCKDKFILKENEIKFYLSKGFELPKRCKPCREKRKKGRLNDQATTI